MTPIYRSLLFLILHSKIFEMLEMAIRHVGIICQAYFSSRFLFERKGEIFLKKGDILTMP